MTLKLSLRASLLAGITATVALPQAGFAYQAAAPQNAPVTPVTETTSGDIIVTARHHEETSIATPVAITAVSGAQLQQRGITNVDALARVVPTLITSEATSSPQGGIVSIRGLSGVDANPFGD